MKGLPLKAEVVDGELVVRIGVETLAYAVAFANWSNPYDEHRLDYFRSFAIQNPHTFAVDVCHALNDEAEDGSTILTNLLDEACEEAVNQGSEGLADANVRIKFGKFHGKHERWATRSEKL